MNVIMPPNYCLACGCPTFKKIGEVGSTRKWVCSECWTEVIEFIHEKNCKHEFNTRNECMFCGKSR